MVNQAKKRRRPGAMRHAWLCFALFFLFTGVSHAEDARGWLLALDLALAQPTGVEQPLALVSAPQSERISLEHDADLAWGAGLGYAFGPNHGRIQVSYWTFENDDAENFTRTGTVFPQLFGYGYYGSFYLCNQSSGGCDPTLPVNFAGTFNIKASTWDLDYADTVEVTEHFGLKWLAGLRTASYEQEQTFEGFDGYYTYLQDKSLDVDAIGIRVGAAGDFHLSQHFSLRGGLAYASLIGTSEGKASQRLPELLLSESRSGKDDNFSGSILDLELSGVWSAGPVDISLGFKNSQWNGFPRDQVPAVGFDGTESSVDDSISFSSFEVGLLWRFGRQRFTSP